jgi:hypothetical protein
MISRRGLQLAWSGISHLEHNPPAPEIRRDHGKGPSRSGRAGRVHDRGLVKAGLFTRLSADEGQTFLVRYFGLGANTPRRGSLRDHELGAGPSVTAGWARNAYAVLPFGRPVFSGHNISAFTQAGLKPFPECDQ